MQLTERAELAGKEVRQKQMSTILLNWQTFGDLKASGDTDAGVRSHSPKDTKCFGFHIIKP